jgi:hypothetical protein
MAKKLKKPAKAKKQRTPVQKLKRMLAGMQQLVEKEGGFPYDDVDWSDPIKRGAVANEVLSFGSETAGQPEGALDNYGVMLRRAFSASGLNPNNPHNWQFLIRVFAFIHFGPTPTEQRYVEIASEFRKAAKDRLRKNAIADVAEQFSVTERTVYEAIAWTNQTWGR